MPIELTVLIVTGLLIVTTWLLLHLVEKLRSQP